MFCHRLTISVSFHIIIIISAQWKKGFKQQLYFYYKLQHARLRKWALFRNEEGRYKNLPTLHFYICQKETLNNFSKNFLDIFFCFTYFLQYSSIFNNNVALNNFFSSLLDLKQNYSSFSDANYLQIF